jgi:succinoglycan biosynthesis protein ExoL
VRIFYLVHDLDDAAVGRRVRFLRQGGATVTVTGFRRQQTTGPGVMAEGLEIGVTRNGRMLQRIAAASRAILSCGRWRQDLDRADIVIARNLEMLAIAVAVRGRVGATMPIAYECLDIHRLMTRADFAGASLRRMERRLLRSTALLLTSSPRFISAYFDRFHGQRPPSALLENKLLATEVSAASGMATQPPSGPPWRIGWFGIIRCRKSLGLLANLVQGAAGRIEVDIRGRPARDAVPDFDAVVGATPGLSFGGPYNRATDLADLYGQVHFNWTVDFYDEGENSAWLLPNRLYEGSLFGAVPIALRDVEAGAWLNRHDCGVLLDAPLQDSLRHFFQDLTQASYDDARARVAGLDRDDLIETAESAAAFVTRLRHLASHTPVRIAQGQAA